MKDDLPNKNQQIGNERGYGRLLLQILWNVQWKDWKLFCGFGLWNYFLFSLNGINSAAALVCRLVHLDWRKDFNLLRRTIEITSEKPGSIWQQCQSNYSDWWFSTYLTLWSEGPSTPWRIKVILVFSFRVGTYRQTISNTVARFLNKSFKWAKLLFTKTWAKNFFY